MQPVSQTKPKGTEVISEEEISQNLAEKPTEATLNQYANNDETSTDGNKKESNQETPKSTPDRFSSNVM